MVGWASVVFNNSVRDYAIFFGAIAFGALLGKGVSWAIRNIIHGFASKTETKLDDVIVDVCNGPLVLAIFVATVAFAEHLLVLSPGMEGIYSNIVRVLVTVTLSWAVIRFLDSLIEHYLVPYTAKTESDLDDVLVPILHTTVKIVIISVGAVMVLSDFGFNVAGLVAGLGIGGLAFAFAAKDLIGNIFGGISVITDKPFKIGDMVKFDSRQGVVKEIGIRTTRIETLDGTMLIIPNAKFTDGIIENVTKRKQHRVLTVLTLEYSTSSKKLEEAKKILLEIAKKHKGIKDEATVFFSAFSASSVDLTFIYFITDVKSIPAIQDAVNMQIKARFEKAKIEFAYPTQTVIYKK